MIIDNNEIIERLIRVSNSNNITELCDNIGVKRYVIERLKTSKRVDAHWLNNICNKYNFDFKFVLLGEVSQEIKPQTEREKMIDLQSKINLLTNQLNNTNKDFHIAMEEMLKIVNAHVTISKSIRPRIDQTEERLHAGG